MSKFGSKFLTEGQTRSWRSFVSKKRGKILQKTVSGWIPFSQKTFTPKNSEATKKSCSSSAQYPPEAQKKIQVKCYFRLHLYCMVMNS